MGEADEGSKCFQHNFDGMIKYLRPQLTIVNDSGSLVNVTFATGSTGCAFDAPYSVDQYRQPT